MTILTRSATEHPRRYVWVTGLVSVQLCALVLIPTLAPQVVPFLAPLQIDTDPETMLPDIAPPRCGSSSPAATIGI